MVRIWENDGGLALNAANLNALETDVATALGREPALPSGTSAQYLRGDKTMQTLNKAAVGLANADNTSDANKPVSTAQATAIGLKKDADPVDTRLFGTFKADIASVLSTDSKPVFAIVGDSIGIKFNASSIANSWAGKLTTDLKALKGDGGSGFRGMAHAGYAGGTFLSGFWDQYATDDKVTLSGSAWANSTSAPFAFSGPGATMGATSTVGSTASFRVAGNTISIYYLGVTTTGGTFTVTVDGVATGGTINVGSRASDAPAKSTITTTAGTGMHTVVITLASGGLNLYGVSGENSTGAVVNNFCKGGLSATTMNTGTLAGADWNGGVDYPADVIIYALGINDLATTDAAASQVADHVRKFFGTIRAATITAPVIVVTNHAGKRDVNFRHVAVQSRLREIAEGYGGAYVDLWTKYDNSWDVANAAGYWGSTTTIGVTGTDDVHPSDTGHTAAYATIKPVILP